MISKDEARKKIEQLVEKFEENKEFYLSPDYNETQTRRELIDPFFKALGWDMDNEKNEPEPYKDVIHEDKIYDGKGVKAPDYCFTIYGHKKFFVEAKKPSVDIKDQISPIYQVRRYGWSASLPVCVLTDFEEFAIYQCTKKPTPKDKPIDERIRYFRYKQYIEEFDYIWEYFSRESVHHGSLIKLAKFDIAKRGTEAVNKEFLKSLEEWRKLLAVGIALRNPSLTEEEINYAVQQTIDRIIFLRICEDRKVEKYARLSELLNGDSFYQNLFSYFKAADEKYNSGLFDFSTDKITPQLNIDNKIIKTIINELYYPECPYEFSVLPIEILGNAYEQFLGKVIRLTAGHQAKVEEKPEVRKAGGIYYTPQYIVDYIVKNTVGKLIEGKTPEEISKIKICDPACGSGSFLIGAYHHLLDYHLKYYIEHPKSTARKKDSPLTPEGRLSTSEKKRILINNIFGVDIDSQAVEVTKLSLLLKAMEGETDASIKTQLTLFNERVLPSLENNIKCGNSLIGLDFYDGQLELEPKEERKIRPFDWKEGFKNIFDQGGFDCIIGNPPWGATFKEYEKIYLSRKYFSFQGNYESILFFIDKSCSLLKKEGLLSFITPDSWIKVPQSSNLRKILLSKYSILNITVLPVKVFSNVNANSIIFIIRNFHDHINCQINIMNNKADLKDLIENKFEQNDVINTINWLNSSDYQFQIFQNEKILKLIRKIESLSDFANKYLDVMQGIVPYSTESLSKKDVENRIFHSSTKISNEYGLWIKGRCISRYDIKIDKIEYLKYGSWLHRPRQKKYFLGERILIQEITGGNPPRISATFYSDILYHDPGIISCLPQLDLEYHLFFLLGIINSHVISFYHKYNSPKGYRNQFPKVLINDIRKFPIPKLDLKYNKNKNIHNEIVKHVDTMLSLNKELNETKLPDRRTQLESHIEYTDRKIDSFVYKLYNLTEDEIKIVEGEKQ